MAAHLSPEFGTTVNEIEEAGFAVDARIECLLSSDSDVGMAKTIGLGTLALADALGRLRPDILLLIADRYELLAAASVALALRIPIAHIEGGEISEGAVDDAVRNAMTKMSHLHFTPSASATRRVLAMGEENWRVHQVGAPSLDHLVRSELPDRPALENELGLTLDQNLCVVSYHPVTLLTDTTEEAGELFGALSELDCQLVFCFPNADAGSRMLIDRTRAFCAGRPNSCVVVNLAPLTYWSLLREARVMCGNSSSGIMEAPSLKLPVVNIGLRQRGRERAKNIIDAPAERAAILSALRTALGSPFRAGLADMTNPYGDGQAGDRIAEVLTTCPTGDRLLMKRALPVVDVEQKSGGVAFRQNEEDEHEHSG